MKRKKNLKLAIVGHGFVGKATDKAFNKNVEKFIVDPIYETKISDLKNFKPEIIFICVPTPMGADGSQDCSIINEVIYQLNDFCNESIKVIKSTVLPSSLEILKKSNSQIIYNPEFLREKHADMDFINAEMIIFGGDKKYSQKVSNIYQNHSSCKTKNYIFTDLVTASLAKYAINTFLASKIIFFNELFSVFNKYQLDDSWEDLVNIISSDSRIGKSHMSVPGHDGKKGFGGACFPKDCTAFVNFAKEQGVELTSLKTTVKTNNKIRSEYTKLDSREIEQNVRFDDKI